MQVPVVNGAMLPHRAGGRWNTSTCACAVRTRMSWLTCTECTRESLLVMRGGAPERPTLADNVRA
jgi:hypothetical protein